MPIYEYHCNKCEDDFELLVGIGAGDKSLRCPKCGGDDLKKLFSTFAARSKGAGGAVTSSGPSSCGGCSSSNCGSCS